MTGSGLRRGSASAAFLAALSGIPTGLRGQPPATFALLTPPPDGVGLCDSRYKLSDTPHAHWRSRYLRIVSPDSAWRRELRVDDDTTGGFTSVLDYVSREAGRENRTVDQVRVLLAPDGTVGGGSVHHVVHLPPGGWRPGLPPHNTWPQPSPPTADEVVRARALAAWLRSRCGG